MNHTFPGLQSPVKCVFTKLSQSPAKVLSFLENVIIYKRSLGPCSSQPPELSPEGNLPCIQLLGTLTMLGIQTCVQL